MNKVLKQFSSDKGLFYSGILLFGLCTMISIGLLDQVIEGKTTHISEYSYLNKYEPYLTVLVSIGVAGFGIGFPVGISVFVNGFRGHHSEDVKK